MRSLHLTVVMMLFPVLAFSQVTVSARMVDEGGAGPYKAVVTSYSSMPDYTVYRPARMQAAFEKTTIPLVVFAGGECPGNSSSYERYLSELASFGYFVVATGSYREENDLSAPYEKRPQSLTRAIDEVCREVSDPESEFYGLVNTSRVAVIGHSCGGDLALSASSDPRVSTTVCMNGTTSGDGIGDIHSPLLFITGGEEDGFFQTAVDNLQRIGDIFAAALNYAPGKDGTFSEPYGGEFAMMTLQWLEWQLKDVSYARGIFTGEECLCAYTQWSMQNRNADLYF